MEGKKELISVTFIVAMGGIGLIVASLATEHWVQSKPLNRQSNTTSAGNEVSFGLFKGVRTMTYIATSPRTLFLKVACDAGYSVCTWFPEDFEASVGYPYATSEEHIRNIMENKTSTTKLYQVGMFSYALWTTTIMSGALSIVFGLISMGFALFNVLGKPIETITGPLGLYLWNGLAFLFSLLELILFLVLYLTTFSKNFLPPVDAGRFETEGHTQMGYSFYLVAGATALYLVNIIVLFCSGYKLRCSFSSEAEKVVDNGMILY